tara:strand:+ start:13033 stop:13428 length:396 start_codon:yes stop_codon:yes gene_type:complete
MSEKISTMTFSSQELKEFHQEEIRRFDTPEWAYIKCEKCSESNDEPVYMSTRTIGYKLNARNIGDIVVEACCDTCLVLDTFYFKSEIKNSFDFANIILGERVPENEPIIEQEMFKQQYNNLIEAFVSKEQK